jgi:hypothetical protein
MPPLLEPKALRSQPDVRAAVDRKLGLETAGPGGQALDALLPAERVEWLFGELLVSLLDRRFHVWVQRASEESLDVAAALASILEQARSIDPQTADLLRWIVERGRSARTGSPKDGLVSLVPEVALGAWEEIRAFHRHVVEHWPHDQDPFALPAPASFHRKTSADRRRVSLPLPRAPEGDEDTAPLDPQALVERLFFELWSAGADDDTLDAAFSELAWQRDSFPEFLVRWADVDGRQPTEAELEALRARLFPATGLAAAFGVSELPFPGLGLVAADIDRERFEEDAVHYVRAHLAIRAADSEDASAGRPELQDFASAFRAGLRRDPDVLIVSAGDVDEAGASLLAHALTLGMFVLVFEPTGVATTARQAAKRLEASLAALGVGAPTTVLVEPQVRWLRRA